MAPLTPSTYACTPDCRKIGTHILIKYALKRELDLAGILRSVCSFIWIGDIPQRPNSSVREQSRYPQRATKTLSQVAADYTSQESVSRQNEAYIEGVLHGVLVLAASEGIKDFERSANAFKGTLLNNKHRLSVHDLEVYLEMLLEIPGFDVHHGRENALIDYASEFLRKVQIRSDDSTADFREAIEAVKNATRTLELWFADHRGSSGTGNNDGQDNDQENSGQSAANEDCVSDADSAQLTPEETSSDEYPTLDDNFSDINVTQPTAEPATTATHTGEFISPQDLMKSRSRGLPSYDVDYGEDESIGRDQDREVLRSPALSHGFYDTGDDGLVCLQETFSVESNSFAEGEVYSGDYGGDSDCVMGDYY